MTSNPKNDPVSSFGHFLEYLRLNKFKVTVAHYTRVQRVLDFVIEDLRPDEPESIESLKGLLCPIFAINEMEQLEFSMLFDKYVEHCWMTIGVGELKPRGLGSIQPKVEPKRSAGIDGKTVETKKGWRHALEKWRNNVRRELSFEDIVAAAFVIVVLVTVTYTLFIAQPSGPVSNTEQAGTPSPSPIESPVVTPNPTTTSIPTPTPQRTQQPSQFPFLDLAVASVLFLLLYALLRRVLYTFDPKSYVNKKPPFKWPLRIAAPEVRLYNSEEFRRAAHLLRRRYVDEFFRLDLRATVSATIRSLGYPSFRYKPATRVPEYLALIERASPRDHQARLFDGMLKALRRDGVRVTRYFYGDDPLVCYDESGENRVHLEYLKQRYADHRLLIFGSGDHLLDPLTGRFAEWTGIFSYWYERALLTPESNWSWREHVLSEKFVVVPATLDGLLRMVNYLESPAARSSRGQPPSDPYPLQRQAEATVDLTSIRLYLGSRLYQWLCACAVYPELIWELTLLLGSLPAMPKGITTEESLLRLSCLSWFRKGSIPDTARVHLIEALESARGIQTREALVRLMEDSPPPPPDTYASDTYQLELALQRWLLRKDKASLRELRGALKRVPPRHILRDEVLGFFLRTVPQKFFRGLLFSIFYWQHFPPRLDHRRHGRLRL
jgi:hypothetical protein